MIFMDKQPKIAKRRRAGIIESKTDSVLTSESSFAGADELVDSAELADLDSPIESVEPPTSTESW